MGKTGPKPNPLPSEILTGKVFGKLSVMAFIGKDQHGKAVYLCECQCGGTTKSIAGNLKLGLSKTCGRCVSNTLERASRATMHRGLKREYRKWKSAQERCRPNAVHRKNYFDRGIYMCAEWMNDFLAFIDHIGPCPEGYTLDRIDNSKGYQPGNVRWVPPESQATNKTNNKFIAHNGETLHIAEWARRTGLSQGTISHRLIHGWPIALALNTDLTQSECISIGLRYGKHPIRKR